ncbi:MAG TPA: ABC transporter substrate-binding protein [Fastidiosipila sp.]|jgi:iron complex transport system substrate-binding protein|nr:ABC transporter substrate-binding protein [Fastidiosipila sp.]
MHLKKTLLSLTLVVLLLLSACGPATVQTTAPPTDEPTSAVTTVQTDPVETETEPPATETDPPATEPADSEPAESTKPAEAGTPIVIKDMADREVTLEKAAERIVAVMPSDVEIIFALNAGDRLVGRGQYADYPEAALEIAEVSSGQELNAEQVLALEPDLVLLTTMAQNTDQLEMIEKAGVKVAVSDAQDIEGVYEAIKMIGTLLGEEEKAEALTADMKARFAALEEKAKKIDKSEKGTVYFEVSPLEFGLWTAGDNTFMQEIATMLGYENAFADVDGWGEISEEQVLSRDPDTIVTVAMYFGEGPKPDEEIAGRTGWDELKAVKEKRIFMANSDEFSRPGPRLADGAEALFDFFYPDHD